jgi:hypothetical protein
MPPLVIRSADHRARNPAFVRASLGQCFIQRLFRGTRPTF